MIQAIRFRSAVVALATAVLLLGACAGEEGGAPTPREEGTEAIRGDKGDLVIVGGALADDNTPVYQAVLDGRSGQGPLCVLPTASGSPESSMESYVSAFDALGGPGTARGILVTVDDPGRASDPSLAQELGACSGFFFTGGSQSRIADVFLPQGQETPAFQALRDRYEEGAVVSGSSAGAAILSDPMIAGGSSEASLQEGIRREEEGEGVWLREGFGFMDPGIVDQHFLARGRWGRLLVALLGFPEEDLGFGIDENTALVVRGDTARVVGVSGVVYLDAREARPEEDGNGGEGVVLYLLGDGDGVELAGGQVIRDASKPELGSFPAPSRESDEEDLFASWNLLETLYAFGVAPDSMISFRQEEHVLEFRKGPGFQASAREDMGVRDTPRGLFLGPLLLRVREES